MHKTTIYLDDEDIEALRQHAEISGVSQAELIRGAIRQVVPRVPTRRFRSLGKGSGPGQTSERWNPADLYKKAFGD